MTTDLFEEIKQDQLRLQEKIKNHGQEALKQYFSDFFVNNPTVHAVRWAGFTPYFNDGDECVYCLHDPEILLVSDKDVEDEEYGSRYSYGDSQVWFSSWSSARNPDPLPDNWDEMTWQERNNLRVPIAETDAIKQLSADLSANEEVFKMVFGDHVQVTATRDGFEVEEYDHD